MDGSGLEQLTHTTDRGEANVSVHANGTAITWNAAFVTPPETLMELWVGGADGSWAHKVFTALDRLRTVHDPELSPDGTELVFSMRNVDYTNFPDNPAANTAHDLYRVRVDGTELTRISAPRTDHDCAGLGRERDCAHADVRPHHTAVGGRGDSIERRRRAGALH